jgi:hypothetical protein
MIDAAAHAIMFQSVSEGVHVMSIYSEWHSACRSMDSIEEQRTKRDSNTPFMRRIEPAKAEPEELPLMQQLAVLQMMNSTLARGVAKRLASVNDCQDRPSHFDYCALVAHGLAYKAEDDRWHTLTVEGWAYARAMLTRLCQINDIHIMQNTTGKGCTYFKCSCGQWSTILYGSPGMHQFRRAHNGWMKHVPVECKRAERA